MYTILKVRINFAVEYEASCLFKVGPAGYFGHMIANVWVCSSAV